MNLGFYNPTFHQIFIVIFLLPVYVARALNSHDVLLRSAQLLSQSFLCVVFIYSRDARLLINFWFIEEENSCQK